MRPTTRLFAFAAAVALAACGQPPPADQLPSSRSGKLPGAAVTSALFTPGFSADWESGLGAWTAETTSGTCAWHVVTNPHLLSVTSVLNPLAVTLPDGGAHLPARGGTSVAWFGEDSTGTYIGTPFNASANNGGDSSATQTGTLTSPPFALAAGAAAAVEFDAWWEIEGVAGQDYDLMSVQVSTDGAAFDEVGLLNPTFSTNAPSQTGYTAGGSSAPPEWRHYAFDVSGYAGQTIWVRFSFDTGDSAYNGFRGWTIDNVEVGAGAAFPAPVVTAVTPAIGTADDLVTVQGSGFVQGATLWLGGTQIDEFSIVQFGTDEVVFVVPFGLVGGTTYDVQVINPDLQAGSLAGAFTYSDAASPAVFSVSPSTGTVGVAQPVTIDGANFVAGATVAVGPYAATDVVVGSAGSLTATFPPMPAGNYNVTVTTPTGQSGTAYTAYSIDPVVDTSTVTLTSPNGGEVWATGSSHAITWTQVGVTTVALDLYKGGSFDRTIATDVAAGPGTTTWAIPAGLAAGADYSIRITNQLGAASDYGDAPFSLTSAPSLGIAVTPGAAAATVPGAPVVLDPTLTVSSPSDLDGATVSISAGFAAGQDVLAFADLGGITGSYDPATGFLTLSGTASAAAYQAALRTVTYANTAGGGASTAARQVTFALGSGLNYTGNGHFYEFVASPAVTWTDAAAAASGRSYFGLTGYLATVTSAGENDFIAGKLGGDGWVGASTPIFSVPRTWSWVTGPEAGTAFYTQTTQEPEPGGGEPLGASYANWAGGEPNNWSGIENYAHLYAASGQWNDFAGDNGDIAGYAVEYGGMPGDPTPILSGTRALSVALGAFDLAFQTDGTPGASLAGDLAQSVPAGESATPVTASAPATHRFVEWTGTGGFVTTSANPLTVAGVTASQVVTAHFALLTATSVAGGASPDPSTFGQDVTFTATVSEPLATGTVQFALDGVALGAPVPVLAGLATTDPAPIATVGPHEVTATYSGDSLYAGSTTTFGATVNPAPTSLVVAASPSPATFGQPVTLGATLSTPLATGTIQFSVDGVAVGAPVPVVAGAATAPPISGLAAGPHEVSAAYSGDAQYAPSADLVGLSVTRGATAVDLVASPNPSVLGQEVVLTAAVTAVAPAAGLPAGLVTFRAGAAVLGVAPLAGGLASLGVTAFPVGLHPLTATYEGDASFAPSAPAALDQQVDPAATAVALVAPPAASVYGQPVTWTAAVVPVAPGQGEVDGTITFLDGTVELATVPVAGGLASFTSDALAAGDHLVTARFDGTPSFLGSQDQAPLAVGRATTNAAASVAPLAPVFGQPVTLSVEVVQLAPSGLAPTGDVTILDGATVLGTVTLDAAGLATFTTAALAVGDHELVAAYPGTAGFEPATALGATFSVSRASSATTLASGANPATYGDAVLLTATVAAVAPGAAAPTGTVTFRDGATVLGAVALEAGQASLALPTLPAGHHPLVADYAGDGHLAGSASPPLDQVIDRAAPVLALAASVNPSVFGQPVTWTVTVSSPVGLPGGAVTFSADGVDAATVPLDAAGVATFTSAGLPVGAHALAGAYSGDANFLPATAPYAMVVDQAATEVALVSSVSPSVFGAPVTFTATVAALAPGAGVPQGAVVFSDGATVLGTGLLGATAVATFTTAGLEAGPHDVTARYLGDPGFLEATSAPLSQAVAPAPVTLLVGSAPQPSVSGELVTISVAATADAPSAAVPAGDVTVFDGARELLTLPLDAAGRAEFPSDTLLVGDHPLTATLAGSARFAAAASAPTVHVVHRAQSTVVLSAAPSPSFYGQPVTFTAAVSALPPGVGLPGGLVTFRDGATVLGAATLDASGLATFTSAGAAPGALLAGDHQITAAYEGDAAFEPRTAATFTQVVTAAAAELVASVSPALAASGQAVTIRATVTSTAGIPGGQVDFLDNGVTLLGSAALDAAGQASLSIATLAVGTHPISVRYAGAADYQPVAAQVTAVVEPAATTTSLAAAPAAPVVGQPVTLTATLQVVAPGAGSPGGSVTFLDGATVLGTAPVDADGVATFTTATLGSGPHQLGASYPGDDRFGPSDAAALALTTGRASVEVTVAFSPSPTVIGQAVTVSVVVSAAAPGAGTPTGTVDLRDGNVLVTSMTLAAGRGTATTTTLAAGAKVLTAAYAGDADFLPGSASAAHTVARASTATALRSSAGPARYGQPVTFTATVEAVAPGAGHPAGSVTFRDGGATLGTVGLDSVGVATLTLSSLGVGLHTVTASFPGDPSFGPSSGAFDEDVLRADATAQVAAAPSPAMVGQAVTFTVALSAVAPSAGVPGGTVTVRDGPTVLGTAAVGPAGVATFTTTSLGAGDHQVTVEYGGDLGFGPASAEARLSVEAGSTAVTIESDRNPSRRGRPVTLTAMVTSPHATPTGTVSFMDGTTLLGTAALDGNGMATFTTRDLVKGTHPVSAEFDGGQAFAAAGVDLEGGQVVENTPPVAGAGTALALGAGHAAGATATAAGALDQPIGTVELWARTRATPDARQAARLAASAAAPGGTLLSLGGESVRWALGLDAAGTGLVVTLAGATTTVPAAFADGGWHHLALVASEASATLLVDGVEVAVLDGHFDAAVLGERLVLGRGIDGELDEVRLWATPRTTAQLAADARRPLGGTEPWLLGLWRMDEGAGGELFDAGPLHLDATVDLGGVEDATAFAASTAWRHRDAWQERDLAPAVDAGYDADGDALTLALTAPPSHGAATVDHPSLQVAYRAGTGHLGLDQFSYGLSDGAASSEYLIEVSVARILSCQADADCGGGDLCILEACVAPEAVEARAAGCGCTSGGGEALGLWSLLALGLGTLRRARRTAPQAGRKS